MSDDDDEVDPDIADVLAAAVEKYPPGPPLHVLRKALAEIRNLRLALRSVRTTPEGVVFASDKTIKPIVTDAMVDAARRNLVGFDARDWPSRIRDALEAALEAQNV